MVPPLDYPLPYKDSLITKDGAVFVLYTEHYTATTKEGEIVCYCYSAADPHHVDISWAPTIIFSNFFAPKQRTSYILYTV